VFKYFSKAGPWRRAIDDGRILDMGKKPYSTVNMAVGVPFTLAITPAAFKQFVALADTPAHRQLEAAIRWGNILAGLFSLQPGEGDSESVMEINVVEPDGVLRAKTIKVITGLDDAGREAFTFLLPEETDPVSSDEYTALS
jgi:hypothetical protein